jgi:hypothetical protein
MAATVIITITTSDLALPTRGLAQRTGGPPRGVAFLMKTRQFGAAPITAAPRVLPAAPVRTDAEVETAGSAPCATRELFYT